MGENLTFEGMGAAMWVKCTEDKYKQKVLLFCPGYRYHNGFFKNILRANVKHYDT